MCANLITERNFLDLVKYWFTSDVKVSAEHSAEIFKIIDGIILKGVIFLFLIELISLVLLPLLLH